MGSVASASITTAADTRDRILDAAERLFAGHGFDGTSLRRITRAAGANLAAVNYHFGSKEDLYSQVFIRRIVPVNARRTEMLDAAEKRARGRPLPLAAIFDSFVRPIFEMAERAPSFLRLMARNVGAPPPFMAALIEVQFRSMITRYVKALHEALPHLPRKTVFWRMHFVVGATFHCASHHVTIDQLSGGLCRASDKEEMLQHLVDFAVAGMSGPLTPAAGRRRRR